MRITLLSLFSLLCTVASAQSWSYVGGSCPNTEGSARFKIKSNGNILSASFSFNQMFVKEWNGSSWNALPAPATTGVIGAFQIEMHNDTAYLGIGNNGFKCFKWNGTGWTQLGATISATFADGNHDFILDNNGVPFVIHSVNRNIYRFNGSAWVVVYTLPQGSFPVMYGYPVGVDNSVCFNSNNELVYSAVALNRQFFKKLSSTFQESLLGDTAVRLPAFNQYGTTLKRNSNGDLFALFGKFGSRSFVKRLNGSNWEFFGDSSTFGMPSGFHLMEFSSPNTLVMGVAGNVDKKVWTCSGGAFQLLDLISHNGNFTQLTDLEINPVDGKPYVAFNCLPTHSLMRYDIGLTNTNPVQVASMDFQVFPNPSANGIFQIQMPKSANERIPYSIVSQNGKEIQCGILDKDQGHFLDLSKVCAGLYLIKLQFQNQVKVAKLMRH